MGKITTYRSLAHPEMAYHVQISEPIQRDIMDCNWTSTFSILQQIIDDLQKENKSKERLSLRMNRVDHPFINNSTPIQINVKPHKRDRDILKFKTNLDSSLSS